MPNQDDDFQSDRGIPPAVVAMQMRQKRARPEAALMDAGPVIESRAVTEGIKAIKSIVPKPAVPANLLSGNMKEALPFIGAAVAFLAIRRVAFLAAAAASVATFFVLKNNKA